MRWARRVHPLRLAAALSGFCLVGLLVATRTPPPAAVTAAGRPAVAAADEARLAESGWAIDCPGPSGRLVPAPGRAGRTGTAGCRFHPADSRGGADRACGVTVELLIPECGAWWGIYTKPPAGTADWARGVTDVEHRVGRTFDLVSRFHWLGAAVPDDDERQLAAAGRYLRITIASRDRSGRPPRWAALAAGAEDPLIDRYARGLAALPTPVFLSFDHEPEPDVGSAGTAADYVAAWRHLHHRFTAAGARNVIWTWTVAGDSAHGGVDRQLYPGDDTVDWISWDAYNDAGCHHRPSRSFAAAVDPLYRGLIDAGYGTKPFMLSGFGTTDPTSSPSWYAALPTALARHPNLRALILFNSAAPARTDTPARTRADLCDTRVTDQPTELAAYTRAGHAAYLNHPRRNRP